MNTEVMYTPLCALNGFLYNMLVAQWRYTYYIVVCVIIVWTKLDYTYMRYITTPQHTISYHLMFTPQHHKNMLSF